MKHLTCTLAIALGLATIAQAEPDEPPFLSLGKQYMIKFSDGSTETVEVVKRKGDSDWYLVKQTGLIHHTFYINTAQAISVTHLTDKKADPTPTPAHN